MSNTSSATGVLQESFAGFESLDANYIYCPNQFFDICLRHCSRGAVRIVAYVLVETLRWRDADGNPIQQNIEVSYNTLVNKANVARGGISSYLKEAVDMGFLVCTHKAITTEPNQSSQTASYALKWNHDRPYTNDKNSFDGLFAGEGNRSPVPLEFFTHIIPQETRAHIKIVGAVIRHTVGYAHQFGRRTQAPLSYSAIQSYTGIKDRKTVSHGVKHSLKHNYISLAEAGVFDKDTSKQRAASYAIKWLHGNKKQDIGSKNPPEEQFKKTTSNEVQKTHQPQFKKPTSIGSEFPPEKRFKKPTTRKTVVKETNKQQSVVVSLLQNSGFSKQDAGSIAEEFNEQRIKQQVEWLPHREATANAVGMLRRSIEENWTEPASIAAKKKEQAARGDYASVVEGSAKSKAEGDNIAIERETKRQRRIALETQWHQTNESLQREAVLDLYERTNDPTEKTKIKNYDLDNPPIVLLATLDSYLSQRPVAA